MNSLLKSTFSAALLVSIAGCQAKTPERSESDVQFVMDKKNRNKALVGFSLIKATQKDPHKSLADLSREAIVSSCGYEVQLNKSDDTRVQPLNKYAFDSRWGELRGHSEYYGGAVVALTGTVAGAILIGGSSAAGLLVPPAFYGIGPGLFLMTSSALVGGTLGASGENKLRANYEAALTFRELIAREKTETEHFYDDKIETIKNSGNTSKKCPEMTVGELKITGGLKSGIRK